MKKILLSLAACAVTLAAERLPSGLELTLPAGWKLTVSGPGALMVPPAHDAEAEIYVAGVDTDLKTIDDAKLLNGVFAKYFGAVQTTAAEAPVAFKATAGRGMFHSFDARSGDIPAKINLYLVALNGKGVGVLAAIGKREAILQRSADLLTIARSFHGEPVPAPALRPSNSWTQRLSDKRLVQFSTYNSGGNSGGFSSEKRLFLAANGTYAFRGSSSVSVTVPGASGGSAGRSQDEGRWRVVEQGSQAILELTSNQGVTEKIALTMNGTQTLLNGRRWFVTGINE